MAKAAQATQTMTVTDAGEQFREVVDRVARQETRVLVEVGGSLVAAIVSAKDLRRLDELDARRAAQFEAMREFSRAFADVPLEELEEQVARGLEQARAELQAERARSSGG